MNWLLTVSSLTSSFILHSFDVIRFIPPLNVTEEELSQAFEIFAEAVKEVAQSVGVKV
jgi:4-aminobutyrate aminotransferase-like enzyme